MKKDYRHHLALGAVRLSRSDFEALINLIEEQFDALAHERDLELSATANGAKIKTHDLVQFLNHEILQTKFGDFEIVRRGWSVDNDIDRYISVRYYKSVGQIHVSGHQQAWTSGILQIIKNYLRGKRPRLWFVQTLWGWGFSGAIGAMALTAVYSGVSDMVEGKLWQGALVTASATSLLASTALLTWKYPFVVVNFGERKPERLTLPVKIALCAAFFSAVSASMAVANYLRH